MAVAVFDPVAFKIRYPQFANADDARLTEIFDDAGLYLNNTDCSPVQNIDRRTRLLWMVTAHLATIEGVTSADGTPGPVGRLSSAAEGTVSVGYSLNLEPGSVQWWSQTPYGFNFWNATAYLRTFRYFANPTRKYSNNRWP